jgi:16S rRNA (cytosine1402-N4)-methyltransferase
LIGLDRDPMMLALARGNLASSNCHLHHASYSELATVLQREGIDHVDRILLDLGLSSDQLDDRSRGFGFQTAGPLDLRFDTSQGEPASSLLARLDAEALAKIFRDYGEERFSDAIARELVRRSGTIETATDLVEAVRAAIPAQFLRSARKHPATRVFQALRIAVNDELVHLETALKQTFPQTLVPGGRLVVISFHSLEDRLVKQAFRGKEQWQNLTPKPVTASPNEQRINPRSRTAKLRAARRL